MIKNESNYFNGNIYRTKNSISSNIEEESIDKSNNNNNMSLGMTHHRKNNLSFFYGSYILDNGLNKLLKEYKENRGIDNTSYENENENNSNKTKSKKNSALNDKEKNINSSNTNLNTNDNEKYIPFSNSSFYSYSIENEGNQEENITKDDKSSFDNNQEKPNTILYSNNPYYELEKNKEKYNKEKSFIPITNTLRYMKDKDERMTDSYLMALGGCINYDEKKNYLPTSSIIEEEKSELIESTNKKQTLINIKKIIKDKNIKKNKLFEIIKNKENAIKISDDDNKENINNNYMTNKNPNINFDLNKITIKNSYKEEIKKNYYMKNKNNVNSIYKNKLIFPLNNNYLTQKIKVNENFRCFEKNQKFNIINKSKKTIKKHNLYSSNEAISNKKNTKINYANTENNNNTLNTLSLRHHHRFKTEFNLKNIIPKVKYNITQLVNNNNNNTFNKSPDKKPYTKIKPIVINNKNKNNNNKNEKQLIINKTLKNLSISDNNKKKQLNKILVNIKHNRAISISNQINKNNKQNNLLSENIINNKSESLLLQDNKSKKDINKNSQKIFRHKKMCSISTLPNSCSSRVKLKVNKNFKNHSIFRNILANTDINNLLYKDFVLDINNNNDIFIHISNLNQAELSLKEKIKFLNDNEKQEVIEKIKQNNNNLNSDNYIILCENNINIKEQFVFKGFFQYLTEKKKYIKIYGNEKCPNHILIKNSNNDN